MRPFDRGPHLGQPCDPGDAQPGGFRPGPGIEGRGLDSLITSKSSTDRFAGHGLMHDQSGGSDQMFKEAAAVIAPPRGSLLNRPLRNLDGSMCDYRKTARSGIRKFHGAPA